MSYNNATVAHIVAMDINGCIGKDNTIPWHISDDLKRFKKLTKGNVVIMGRKTYESIGSNPLSDRINIVVSRSATTPVASLPNGVILCNDLIEALDYASNSYPISVIWIIGGGDIYSQTRMYADFIERTIVDTVIEDPQVFYPFVGVSFDTVMTSPTLRDSVSGITYRYEHLTKKIHYKD